MTTRSDNRLGPREMSTVMWAAAKSGIGRCGLGGVPACLQPLLTRMASPRSIQGFNAQDISMTLWAIATLMTEGSGDAFQLPAGLMAMGGDASHHHLSQALPRRDPVSSVAKSSSPSLASSRLSGLGALLPPRLLPNLVGASLRQLPFFGSQALSNTLWALARLRVRPGEEWLSAAMRRMLQTMSEATPQALANSAWALVVLERRPEWDDGAAAERRAERSLDAEWRRSFLTHSMHVLKFAPPATLAQIAWAATRLRLRPDALWLGALAARAATFVSSSSSSSLDGSATGGHAHSISGTVRSRSRSSSAPSSPQDASNVLWALASHVDLHRPTQGQMQSLLAACLERLQGFSPNELCSVVWSTAK